eukprot:TRINITY_DN4975_c0_g1_i17.p1 TRINITY_DN4975_c0_g1~~TRINITY_DN4975_c0_g1_i17.p1  ORF type:complete len:237 (-),score=48.70 TRINITY_DN4975_c0_g1_i17:269-979(-)
MCIRDSDKRVILCPICQKSVPLNDKDEDEAWNQHFLSNCDSKNYVAKVEEKSRKCSMNRCSTKLTTLNTYSCRKCQQDFCLSHRFEDSHKCQPITAHPNARPDRNIEAKVLTTAPVKPPQNNSGSATVGSGVMIGTSNNGANSNRNAFENRGGGVMIGSNNTNPAPTASTNPTNCSTAHRNAASAGAGNNNPVSAGGIPENYEFCELCGQSFLDIADLITHVEHLHLSSGKEISSR